jgi:hypothetical protein
VSLKRYFYMMVFGDGYTPVKGPRTDSRANRRGLLTESIGCLFRNYRYSLVGLGGISAGKGSYLPCEKAKRDRPLPFKGKAVRFRCEKVKS